MEEKTKTKKPDRIEPTQLVRVWSDEYCHENSVLATFTSRKALGLYLVELMEDNQTSSYSPLHDLFLKKIKINAGYGDVTN